MATLSVKEYQDKSMRLSFWRGSMEFTQPESNQNLPNQLLKRILIKDQWNIEECVYYERIQAGKIALRPSHWSRRKAWPQLYQ